MRREWIEMVSEECAKKYEKGLPPCGGSGLKYPKLDYYNNLVGLPPCGGSGLKFAYKFWEIWTEKVSLHAEGVD